MNADRTYDTAVIGAGVFGAWTAYRLREASQTAALLRRLWPGEQPRQLRRRVAHHPHGYGADEIYTRWAARSLALWQEFFQQVGRPLFQRTGVLWLARADDPYTLATLGTLAQSGIRFESLSLADMESRFPQFNFGPDARGVFEPDSGVILARSAVREVVREAVERGVLNFGPGDSSQPLPFVVSPARNPYGFHKIF